MPTKGLEDGRGAGDKLHHETASLSDTDTLDTGLQDVEHAWAQSPTGSANTANISGISGGTVTLELVDDTATAVTTDENVDVFAIGR